MERNGQKSNIDAIRKESWGGEVGKLKSRGINLHLHWGEISGFEDEEFYGFAAISNSEDNLQSDSQKEVGIAEFTILTYGGNTDEWEEANANLEEKEKDLREKIELWMRFEEL